MTRNSTTLHFRTHLILMAAALVTTQAPAPASAAAPNFVIIMVDDMGYGDAGCYGGKAFPTENIDRLASEGMRFTDFHSSCPVCSPTRAGLLTGRYQQRAGVDGVIYAAFNRNRHHGLQHQEITFAEVLKEQGYATGLFGKWHLGYQEQYNPTYQGFDWFVGYVSGNVDFHSHIDGAAVFDWWHQNQHNRETGYTTHLITRHAVEFIRAKRDTPFCLYIAHEAPHDPYQGPHDEPVREEGKKGLRYNHREPQHAERAYAEMMIAMDQGVGEVMQTIKELGLAETTFVMFFSDNGATGPGSCGNLYGMKGSLWEGGHRVPGIAWWPRHIEPGTVSDQLAFTIDVMPTLLDLAAAPLPRGHHLDGTSLVPLLTEGKSLGERQLFWQYRDGVAMRDGPWKLVINGGGPVRRGDRLPHIDWDRPADGRDKLALFQLDEDPAEHQNLAAEQPDRVAAMRAAIAAWRRDVAAGATPQPEKRDSSPDR